MKTPNKIKLLTISDHPLVPSGVGSQTRYLIEGLLKTGRYTIRSLGGAMKHDDYRPVKIGDYGDDWVIFPVDGYGSPQILREIIEAEKPDAIWFMTDPRFYYWLVEMSDEIRDRGIPLLYFHVWDNHPVPQFNKPFYASCDFIGCISKLTYDIVATLGFADRAAYIPHAVNAQIFTPHSEDEVKRHRIEYLGKENADKFVALYNSRNARRKMTADVLKSFKMFLNEVGQDKGILFAHTDPHDQEGSNLYAVAQMLGLELGSQLRFSIGGVPTEQLAKYYNMADVTMALSNNEGFGISVLETLSCGRLAVINETGGMQDQIRDENGVVFGASCKPATRSIMGSQQIPYIFDDRAADADVVKGLVDIYNMPFSARRQLGKAARDWTLRAFSMQGMVNSWDNAITQAVDHFKKNGSPSRIKLTQI